MQGGRRGQRGKKNTWYQFWSDGFPRVYICCVIETPSSASLPPLISAVYGAACHTFARTGGREREPPQGKTSCRLGGATDYRVLSSILAGRLVPSLPRAQLPRSACLSLSSQWPILHHRWGRQKGETTARLLFGETRSVQLSERRGEGRRATGKRGKDGTENAILPSHHRRNESLVKRRSTFTV